MSYSQLLSIQGSGPRFRITVEDIDIDWDDLIRQIDDALGGHARDIFGDEDALKAHLRNVFGIQGKK